MPTQRQLVSQLFAHAKKVRAWAEDIARNTGRDAQTLKGMCAIAAFELFSRLKADPKLRGRTIVFAKSEFHAFVLVDGLVVDVTATQFINTDPVEGVWIADLSDEPDPGVWAPNDLAETCEEILALSCWRRWVLSELPLPLQPAALAA
jgi:hypothetical protein